MTITIDFTYEVVTPESAENGDFEENGFIEPGFWKYPIESFREYERQQWKPGTLAEFIYFARELGICTDEGASWLYSVDPDIDYRTGSETRYAMHISGATPSSQARIHRLLTGTNPA